MTGCALLAKHDKIWLQDAIGRDMTDKDLDFTCSLLKSNYSLIMIAYLISNAK